MENYDLTIDNIKEKNWVIQRVQESLNNFKNNLNLGQKPEGVANNETEGKQENSSENGDSFYEKIDTEKVTLKMDIVTNYLKNIKDVEWGELMSKYTVAWIMAVQIALRSPKIGGENHNKFGEIKIDGFLGPETKAAVEKFQTEYGLQRVDGLPGKETMNKMCELLTGEVVATGGSEDVVGEGNVNEDDKTSGNEKPKDDEKTKNNEKPKNKEKSKDKKNTREKEPRNIDRVPIKEYIPDIQYDLKYASTDNFIGKKMYNESDEAYLKLEYQAVKKLKKAEELAEQRGYKLKIWDAYRPDEAQTLMWKTYKPNMPYKEKKQIIAPPKSMGGSGSKHGKGQAVDVTLTDKDGNELEMPTKFDEFNGCTYNDIKSGNTIGKQHALELRDIMKSAGFRPYNGERWHFDSVS